MKARVAGVLLLGGLVLLWEAAARGFAMSILVLPPPTAVLQSLWNGLANGFFWPHLRATALEFLLGLVAGSAFGLAAGMLLAEHAGLRRVVLPYVVAIQVVPKLALMPLFIVWFGFGMLPTIIVTALICFFPLMENTLTGLSQVPPERIELFRMLGASRAQTLWRLKLPTGLPAILAGLRIAVVLALVGVVVGEFIGTSQGLGALIIGAQGSMDTPLMFAVLLLISLLGLCAYQAMLLLEQQLLRPYSSGSSTTH
jgi:NitT/TauT family transport system permease protein